MPSLLITTSRKTSNRVRSFARDLWTVLTGTERFNRGSMGLTELAARIRTSGANGALVISMWKGNPGLLAFTTATGKEIITAKIESAKLRREVNPDKKRRTIGIAGVFVKGGSSTKTIEFGEILASFLNIETVQIPNLVDVSVENNWSFIWLEDLQFGKILWTHFHSRDRAEIGPRIRLASIRRDE